MSRIELRSRRLSARLIDELANSKPLWPTQDGEHQRQELMGEMMQARGVDVAAVSRADGGLALLEATTKCRLGPDEEACRH